MRRNLIITALVAVIMGGFVLAYPSIRTDQPEMDGAESASQTGGTT